MPSSFEHLIEAAAHSSPRAAVRALLEGRGRTQWWLAHQGDLVSDRLVGIKPAGVGRVMRMLANNWIEVYWETHPHLRGKTLRHRAKDLVKLTRAKEREQF